MFYYAPYPLLSEMHVAWCLLIIDCIVILSLYISYIPAYEFVVNMVLTHNETSEIRGIIHAGRLFSSLYLLLKLFQFTSMYMHQIPYSSLEACCFLLF